MVYAIRSALKLQILKKASFILVSILLFALLTMKLAPHGPPLKTVNHIDSNRFTGEWYIISNIPYFAEKNKVGSKTTYLKIGENEYQDIFESYEGSFDNELERLIGKAKSLNKENTRWQSTFYRVIRFHFEVIEVDPDYQVMLLGHKTRDYGWLMSRTPNISDKQYQHAMQIFHDNGYDTRRFAKVPQFPEDLGKIGFHYVSN